MHVVLFVLLVAVFAVFLFGLLFPMLKRMQKEVSAWRAAACACTLTSVRSCYTFQASA